MSRSTPRESAASRLYAAVLIAPACLLLAIAGCSDNPTDPAGSQWSGTLYYEGVASGVYSYDFTSGEETALFAGLEPSRFPSGEFLVLSQWASQLEIVSASGAQRTTIYDGGGSYSIFEPKVSPDGQRIAFTEYDRSVSPYSIRTRIISRAGQELVEIGEAGSPEWLSDGRLIVSGSWLYPYSITADIETFGTDGFFIVNAAMTDVTPIPLAATKAIQPTVSPDGSRIAFVLNEHIWTANIDGSGLKQVTTGTKDESYPSFSPDGRFIACTCFGTFETTYYNALAIVPSNPAAPTAMTNEAAIWPRGVAGASMSNRLNVGSYVGWD